MSEKILDRILEAYSEEEFLKVGEGENNKFDDAVIGLSEGFNEPLRLIYSVSKMLEILENEMTPEEALGHFTNNISGSYMGEKTPVWCWDTY